MRSILSLLLALVVLIPSLGHAAAPTTITSNAITSPNEAPESANPFDACRSGKFPGIGWNPTTKRFAATCGNHNFGKYQGIDVVYEVDCTGLGTPHRSCLRSGERRQINALYSLGLAPFYTEDGGTVYVPNFPGKDYAILVDIGCGPGQDGVAVECPQPYDPERLSIRDAKGRPIFSKTGYTHLVELIRGGQRGVNIVFEGKPNVVDELSNTPRLIGGWLVNDRGGDTSLVAGNRSGVNNSWIGNWIFGAGYASFTSGIGYCRQDTSNATATGSFKCDLNPSDRGTQSWAGNQTMSFSSYGVTGKLAASIDTSSAEQISGAFQNGIGVCSANNAEPCNTTADCSSGTCTIGITTTSATCQYDRTQRCWNLAEGANRTAGGCVSDDGSVDLGLCQPFVDALQYDMETGNNSQKKQYGLYAVYGACDLGPEDAASDAACASGSFNHPVTIRSFDQTLTTRCSGSVAEACKEINFGTGSKHPTDTSGTFGGTAFEQRHIPTGIGTAAVDAAFVPFEARTFDLHNTGIQNAGFMPSDWYGKTTCLSSNNVSGANDEAACDSAPLLGHMPGMRGLIGNLLVYNGSYAGTQATNIDGDLGSYYPTYGPGKVLLNRRGAWADPNTGWTYTGIEWLYNYAEATAINFFGPRGKLTKNRFLGNSAAPMIYIGNSAATHEIEVTDNEFSGNGMNSQGPIWIVGGRSHRIERNHYAGFADSFLRLYPGGAAGAAARKFIKNVTVKDNWFRSDGLTTQGMVYLACSDDATTNNEYVQNAVIDGNYAMFTTNTGTPLLRVQDTDASNCRVLENLGSISLTNNTVDSRAGLGCLFGDRNGCTGGTGNVWSSKNTGDATAIVASSNLPYMVGNTVDNAIVPDFPFRPVAAATVSTAAKLGPGAVVAIYDDTVARGTCTDTVPGTLTGGGTFLSVCKVNASGGWDPL